MLADQLVDADTDARKAGHSQYGLCNYPRYAINFMRFSMIQKIFQRLNPTIIGSEEEKKAQARHLSLLIWASWGACFFVFFTALFFNDWKSAAVMLACCALLIAPFALLKRGHLAASSLVVVLMMIGTITLIATVGQGIRDMAIVAFPIIFIFAGLTLNRLHFRLYVGVTLAAISWLAFGEDYGWFATVPLNYPNWLYLITLAIILLVAALAVDLMAINMRKSLELARQEISERMRTEEALRESEMYFRTLFDQAAVGVALLDTNSGRYVRVNQKYCEFLGYTRTEMLAKTFMDVTHSDDVQENADNNALLMAEKYMEFSVDKRYIHKNGGVVWGNLTASPLWKGGEQPPLHLHISVVQDITERKNAENTLQESEERFEHAMQATEDGLYDWNLVTNEIYYSPSWKRMLGYAYEELPNDFSVWEKLTLPEDVQRSWKMQQELINKERERFELEFKMKHKDGHWVDILSRANALFDDTGTAVRIVGTHVDISERKRAEENALASQKMAGIGSLAAGMAHEINSPLQLVTGLSERLTRNLKAGEVDQQQFLTDIESINKNGWRIANIIRSLLTYARKEGHEMAPQQLNVVIENSLLLIEHQLVSWSNVSIEKELAPDLPLIHADSNSLTQVILNLLENARDAMPGGGWIKISTAASPDGEQVVLQISDTGEGMTEELQSHIFDPFFTTKDIGKGTGLGLSIVQGIIQAHSGDIQVKSLPGKGTTFTVCLPVKTPSVGENDSPGRY
jgi:PAS domain S-box-containing protein